MIDIKDMMAVPDLSDLPEGLIKDKEGLSRFLEVRNLYKAAIKEVSTKMDILDDEFRVRNDYNPIHSMEARLKSVDSIVEKLGRRGLPISLDGMQSLMDIAGIRVICNYLDDIYKIEDLVLRQSDIELVKKKDYIANPKETGYRSLHLVLLVPVFLAERTERVPVEIQIRTIAMDTWASLEHELKYKRSGSEIGESDREELLACAKAMKDIDDRMQRIHKKAMA